MGLFDSTEEHPPSKVLRYIITGLVFVGLIVAFVAYQVRMAVGLSLLAQDMAA